MDNAINFSVTPVQALLALAFQVWLLVFPVLILRKLNYLTNLLEEKFGTNQDETHQDDAHQS